MNLKNHIKRIKGRIPFTGKIMPQPETAGAHYFYTGPKNTLENGNWMDLEAYKQGQQDTPTGSIHIKHPHIEMLCRVSDQPSLPGFIISCKDTEGKTREFQVFYNEHTGKLICCTSNKTDLKLIFEHRIHTTLDVPFIDVVQYEG